MSNRSEISYALQPFQISNEDYTWQTELKDMIWLELQAWHADRTLEQQDKYLYSARQGIPDLFNKILNYKFVPRYAREISVTSTDSGISESSCQNSCDAQSKASANASQQKTASECHPRNPSFRWKNAYFIDSPLFQNVLNATRCTAKIVKTNKR